MKKKVLLLAGGGHAHIYILKQLRKKKFSGYDVILVSKSDRQYYSGMIAGFLEGIYKENQIYFDLPKICSESGVEFICSEIESIDPIKKVLITKSQESINFDILSFNTGSDVAHKDTPGVLENSIHVKPLQNFCKIRERCLDAPKKGFRIFIAGAGAAGIEMALAIRKLSVRENKVVNITLAQAGEKILDGYSDAVKKAGLDRICQNRGENSANTSIELIINNKVVEVKPEMAVLASGQNINFDFAIWATGSVSHKIFTSSGLDTDRNGYLEMNNRLQNKRYPFIFGAGDCISLTDYPNLRKLGVFATRQAPLLYKNIVCYSMGKKLLAYKHKEKYLSIISTGDKTAILSYGTFSLSGKIPWVIKNYIDLKFMKNFKGSKK